MCKTYQATLKGMPVSFGKDDSSLLKGGKISVIIGRNTNSEKRVDFFDLKFLSKEQKNATLKELKKHLSPIPAKVRRKKPNGDRPIRQNLVVGAY